MEASDIHGSKRSDETFQATEVNSEWGRCKCFHLLFLEITLTAFFELQFRAKE